MKKPPISSGLLVSIVAVIAFAAGIWLGFDKQDKSSVVMVQDRIITVLPKPKILKPFHLQTGKKKPFTVESLQNKYTIFFFGYTFCPDVCPTTLHVLAKMYKEIEKSGNHKNIQIVFVSVDPDRDTPEILQKYVSYFNKDFVGVSGDAKEIASFAKQLGAAYELQNNKKSRNYDVNHTGLLFITNPKGQYAAILSPPHQSELIQSRLKLLRQLEGQEEK